MDHHHHPPRTRMAARFQGAEGGEAWESNRGRCKGATTAAAYWRHCPGPGGIESLERQGPDTAPPIAFSRARNKETFSGRFTLDRRGLPLLTPARDRAIRKGSGAGWATTWLWCWRSGSPATAERRPWPACCVIANCREITAARAPPCGNPQPSATHPQPPSPTPRGFPQIRKIRSPTVEAGGRPSMAGGGAKPPGRLVQTTAPPPR